jgi:ABC-type amino acid transport substrate-binding protein
MAMDIRPSVAVNAVHASSAQIHHRPRPAVNPALTTAKAEPAASRVSPLPEAPKARPQAARSMSVAAASPEPSTNSKETSESLESARHGVLAGLESPSSGNPDFLVAIVMAGPDIKSVSDLKGRTIAIDDRYSVSGSTVRTAIVAAGAPQVQLSEGQVTAMNRLSNGEVPAAVVALVTPDVADKFPAFAGYRMFQVPLSPYSLKARP